MNYLHCHFSILVILCTCFSSKQRKKKLWIQFSCLKRGLVEKLLVLKKNSGLLCFCTAVMLWQSGFRVADQIVRPWSPVSCLWLSIPYGFADRQKCLVVLALTEIFPLPLKLLPWVWASPSCGLWLLIFINFKFVEFCQVPVEILC